MWIIFGPTINHVLLDPSLPQTPGNATVSAVSEARTWQLACGWTGSCARNVDDRINQFRIRRQFHFDVEIGEMGCSRQVRQSHIHAELDVMPSSACVDVVDQALWLWSGRYL